MAAMAAQAFAVAGGRPVAEPARGGGGMGVLPAAGDSDSDGELAEEARPIPSRAAVPHHVDASGMWQRQVRLPWSPPPPAALRRFRPLQPPAESTALAWMRVEAWCVHADPEWPGAGACLASDESEAQRHLNALRQAPRPCGGGAALSACSLGEMGLGISPKVEDLGCTDGRRMRCTCRRAPHEPPCHASTVYKSTVYRRAPHEPPSNTTRWRRRWIHKSNECEFRGIRDWMADGWPDDPQLVKPNEGNEIIL